MAKKIFLIFISSLIAAAFLCFPAAADDQQYGPKALLIDMADVIPAENEPELLQKITSAVEKTGFSIIVSSTNDIGSPKTDARTVAYADDLYEEYCGKDTDGILLLINCDTEYDYISTSGVCINYFSDYRIELILDSIFDDLVAHRFTKAAETFVKKAEYYYDQGKANHQQEILGQEVDLYDFSAAFIRLMFFTGFAALIVSVSIYSYYASHYKLQAPTTQNYMLKDSLYFTRKNDVFIGNITTRIYSPRSSSSGGGHSSGHSHHSSTHHSSSGGRHGGGGRHR